VSKWGAREARIVLRALEDIGWVIKRQTGAHKVLSLEPEVDDLAICDHVAMEGFAMLEEMESADCGAMTAPPLRCAN
jgi:hypothetical protein